jgi:hypothetical protein
MNGYPHPWRIMTVLFGAVLLCSFGLHHLFSPVGDAVLRAVDGRPATLTGTIEASAGDGRLVLRGDSVTYTLAGPIAAQRYIGHTVRITGVLHESTRLLEIRTIAPFLTKKATRNSM